MRQRKPAGALLVVDQCRQGFPEEQVAYER